MFRESDGKLSLSRILLTAIVGINLINGIVTAFKTGVVVDIPMQWAGLAVLLYGVNKGFTGGKK